MNGYDLFFDFIVYSIIGWLGEVCYAYYVHRRFVNRGFLNGPLCPMYGVGALIFVGLGKVLPHNLLLLFLVSALAATVLEYVTGYLLETIFHRRYWDYSHTRYHIHGYVTLGATVLWGVVGVLAVFFVHPLVSGALGRIPFGVRRRLSAIALALFLIDLVVTVIQNLHLSKRLQELRVLAEKLEDERQQETNRKKLQKEYNKKLSIQRFGEWRILWAFPNLRSQRDGRSLEELRLTQRRAMERLAEARANYQNSVEDTKESYRRWRAKGEQQARQKQDYKNMRREIKRAYRRQRRRIMRATEDKHPD